MHALDSKLILLQNLGQLPVTNEFKKMALINGFSNLDEILSLHLSSLLNRKGFTPDVLQELVELLQAENLLHLLKQG